jgi:abhydrolase domain-containing protein 17
VADLFVVLLGSYGYFALFAFLHADRFLFRPKVSSYRDGKRIFKLQASDGVRLSALHLPNRKAEFTVLYFHGNGEDLGDSLARMERLRALGFGVFAFDYRGYGTSEGSPSEAALYADAELAWRWLTVTAVIPPQRIILYGRSLGGAPAVELAARHPAAGLVLECAFASAFRVVTQVSLIPRDRFRNLETIRRTRCPVLVMHGRRDRTVPFSHGRRLFDAAPGHKRAMWIDEAGHVDIEERSEGGYRTALQEFAAELS